MTAVDATNEFGGVITSSPLLTPSKCNASVKASVPLFKDTQYLVLQIFEMLFSQPPRKIKKSVSFNTSVNVTLIPESCEYKQANLHHEIWYSEKDLEEIKQRTIQELVDSKYKTVKEFMDAKYQTI